MAFAFAFFFAFLKKDTTTKSRAKVLSPEPNEQGHKRMLPKAHFKPET